MKPTPILWFQLALGLFFVGFVLNAWVVDDAYITFRTVDNFVHGRGLSWNVGERVQAYTHPLWMFLMSACYALTGDVFYTSIALSLAACLGTFVVLYRAYGGQDPAETWRASLLVLLVLVSKAGMDYSSSGLENPLSYFLGALFLSRLLFRDASFQHLSLGDIRFLFLVAALAFFNRQDTLLLFLPALLVILLRQLPRHGWKLVPVIVVATLPATLWVLFSLFYYGFPVPNTAFAKAIATGIPVSETLARGFDYLGNSLAWDLASNLMVITALGLALWRRSLPGLTAMLGVALYLAFVVASGAAATHMSGRFSAVPFVFSIIVLTRYLPGGPRVGGLIAAIAAVHLLLNPGSPLRKGTPWYGERDPSIWSHRDLNSPRARAGSALLDYFDGKPLPDKPKFQLGIAYRNDPSSTVFIGDPGHGGAIGYFGFAAGPEKYIIDDLGLADPLLARLPTCSNQPPGSWVSGHFFRILPRGYVASILTSKNQLQNPDLKAYYDKILRITRGSVWSWQRFGDIVAMNLGRYDHLLESYARNTSRLFANRSCTRTVQGRRGPVASDPSRARAGMEGG